MDYFPNPRIQDQDRHFLQKGPTINFINSIGLESDYLHRNKDYEMQLVIAFDKNQSLTELEYLIEGIKDLKRIINFVEKKNSYSEEELSKIVNDDFKKWIEKAKSESDKERLKELIENKKNEINESFSLRKHKCLEFLKKELNEYRIRLGRFNVSVDLSKDIPEFDYINYNSFENLTKVLVNNHPLIFKDDMSFNFFLELVQVMVDKEEEEDLAAYSFIYRKMEKDKLLAKDITTKSFTSFLAQFYNQHFTSLKTLQSSQTAFKNRVYDYIKSKQKRLDNSTK